MIVGGFEFRVTDKQINVYRYHVGCFNYPLYYICIMISM